MSGMQMGAAPILGSLLGRVKGMVHEWGLRLER